MFAIFQKPPYMTNRKPNVPLFVIFGLKLNSTDSKICLVKLLLGVSAPISCPSVLVSIIFSVEPDSATK